jgi:ribonuclease BN (tRNA processing enzyme)
MNAAQMNCVLLGSGGWIPTSRRETCCALVRDDAHALLIDAGTGIHRLFERPDLLAGVQSVDIVLTHFHLDHVIGLSYLPGLTLPEPPTIWGPGELFTGVPTRTILEQLLGPPLFSTPLSTVASAIREVPKTEFEVTSFTLRTRVQERHAEPTLALRIGDSLTYCTDTAPDFANVAFAAGSRALLHDAWYAGETSNDGNHSAGGDAGRIAREARVARLVLIHVHPLLADEESLVASAARAFPNVTVARDLAVIPLI